MADKSQSISTKTSDLTATAEVEQLLKEAESSKLEFKSRATIPAILQTVCAFLNGEGGRIIIGVDDAGRVVKLPDAEGVRSKLLRQVQTQVAPPPNVTVTIVTIANQQVLLVEVVPGRDRPYICNNAIYVRKDGSDSKASATEIVQLINGLDKIPRWEASPRTDLTMLDLDQEALVATREAANRLRYASLPDDTSHLLERLHLVRNGLLTNATAVLFASAVARLFPQTQLRAVHYAHDENRDELVDNQLFSGHAFDLLEQALYFLERNLAIAASIPTTKTIIRPDHPTYPVAAVREGLLNALIHRDYEQFEGGIMLAIYPQRLEIWNAGWLPVGVTVKSLREGGISHPRNPDIARVFMLRGLVERMGSGGPRIVAICQQAGLPAPQWKEQAGGLLFTLHSKLVPGRSINSLNERITQFLATTTPGHQFTVADYQRQTGEEVSDRRSRTDLTQMIEAGVVTRYGKGKATYYVRIEK